MRNLRVWWVFFECGRRVGACGVVGLCRDGGGEVALVCGAGLGRLEVVRLVVPCWFLRGCAGLSGVCRVCYWHGPAVAVVGVGGLRLVGGVWGGGVGFDGWVYLFFLCLCC